MSLLWVWFGAELDPIDGGKLRHNIKLCLISGERVKWVDLMKRSREPCLHHDRDHAMKCECDGMMCSAATSDVTNSNMLIFFRLLFQFLAPYRQCLQLLLYSFHFILRSLGALSTVYGYGPIVFIWYGKMAILIVFKPNRIFNLTPMKSDIEWQRKHALSFSD